MTKIDYSKIEPFEICSIRPPTENYSLTIRLTRNCHWNKCGFCPVYKIGFKYSKRKITEVKKDIKRAKLIDDLLYNTGIISRDAHGIDQYMAQEVIKKINTEALKSSEKKKTDKADPGDKKSAKNSEAAELDPRLAWFAKWFKDIPTIEDSIMHVLSWRMGPANTCFLGDADSLVLKPDFLKDSIAFIKENFPSLKRFTVYGRTRSAAKMSLEDLVSYREAGLDRIHFGLESGCDDVLGLMNKGVSSEEHIQGCMKIREAGISCSVYVMPGLGGEELSEKHAVETAKVLSEISPDYIRLRTLEIFPNTPLEEMQKNGAFTEASEDTIVKEIRTIIENIKGQTIIVSDSASNLLGINGILPAERGDMLQVIDSYLSLSPRQKIEFSLRARLDSFIGQYGEITEDIMKILSPLVEDRTLYYSKASDKQLVNATRLIRSKLMP